MLGGKQAHRDVLLQKCSTCGL